MGISCALPSLVDGFSRYIAEISKFPLLSESEESRHTRAWCYHEDKDAARILVTSHLRLAARVAWKFRGYGLPLQELVSEANLGLVRAVCKFDPEKGVRLSTYASWWIRATVQEYILKFWSVVKVGTDSAHRKLFFGLRRLKRQICSAGSDVLLPDEASEIADELGVSDAEVMEMDYRMNNTSDISLNTIVSNGDTASGCEIQDLIADESLPHVEDIYANKQEYNARHTLLKDAIGSLGDREREIFCERRLSSSPTSLEVLAGRFCISKERVRQIEKRAFEKVSHTVQHLSDARQNIKLLSDS